MLHPKTAHSYAEYETICLCPVDGDITKTSTTDAGKIEKRCSWARIGLISLYPFATVSVRRDPGTRLEGSVMEDRVRGGLWMADGTHAVKPLIIWAYRRMTRSSQPQRLFLPVVTPTSWPLVCSNSPISCRVKPLAFIVLLHSIFSHESV